MAWQQQLVKPISGHLLDRPWIVWLQTELFVWLQTELFLNQQQDILSKSLLVYANKPSMPCGPDEALFLLVKWAVFSPPTPATQRANDNIDYGAPSVTHLLYIQPHTVIMKWLTWTFMCHKMQNALISWIKCFTFSLQNKDFVESQSPFRGWKACADSKNEFHRQMELSEIMKSILWMK